jgi:hypothetical protein
VGFKWKEQNEWEAFMHSTRLTGHLMHTNSGVQWECHEDREPSWVPSIQPHAVVGFCDFDVKICV